MKDNLFPLRKGGSAEGAGVVLRDPKDSGITLSQKLLDNPLALRAAPFVKGECAPGSKRISAQATLRPAFGVQPSASGTTIVHFSGEPLSDERTATENDDQKKQIGEELGQEHSKWIAA